MWKSHNSLTPPPPADHQIGHTVVGSHPIIQQAFITSQQQSGCYSLAKLILQVQCPGVPEAPPNNSNSRISCFVPAEFCIIFHRPTDTCSLKM